MTQLRVSAPPALSGIRQTPCQIRHVRWIQPTLPCVRCGEPAPRVWEASRTASDLDLDGPVLVQVEVSVHACRPCRRHFRAQPPFLRPDAIYTNRIVAKALDAVFRDGLAFRRVPARLARDFWVRPSEAMVRAWCRLASSQGADQDDYLPWVVQTFSGILCIDAVYQGALEVLLAVDPAAPDGDRLIGYQLVDGTVDSAAVTAFLCRLKEAGLSPEEVITDGSALYPGVLAAVWPTAAHQLCLFHETRPVTDAVLTVISQVRRALPTPPPRPRQGRGGPLTPTPPTRHVNDPATQQWHLRRARRAADLQEVHDLASKGYAHQAIARLTGRNRRTVRSWLTQAVPDLSDETRTIAARAADEGADAVLRRRRLTPDRLRRVQDLARAGFSHAAIARMTGLHRVTVAAWLKTGAADPAAAPAAAEDDQEAVPRAVACATDESPTPGAPRREDAAVSPPAPWTSWQQVWQVREVLKQHRWLLLRRPDHPNAEQQAIVTDLVTGPLADTLSVARRFLLDWYALWRTEDGQWRPLLAAQERYEHWRAHADYRAVDALRKVQDLMTATRFGRLSQFLRHPHWEATNNGAERTARAFRHRQAPHYRLRAERAIDDAYRVHLAEVRKRAIAPSVPLPRLCPRGRPRHIAQVA